MVEEDLDCHQPNEGCLKNYEDDDIRVFHHRGPVQSPKILGGNFAGPFQDLLEVINVD
jgi:hypothetical protein